MTLTPKTALRLSLGALMLTACGSPDPAPNALEISEMSPVDRGRLVFKKCQTCHTLGEGERHKVGPNLWAFFGETAGAKEGFAYSKTMTASDVVWTDETLDAYLEKPSRFMQGNRMTFVGLKSPEDRAAVIAYLHDQTDPK